MSPSNVSRNKLDHSVATDAVYQIIRLAFRNSYLCVMLGLIPEKELSNRGVVKINIELDGFRAD
jgi:hypothetical protein